MRSLSSSPSRGSFIWRATTSGRRSGAGMIGDRARREQELGGETLVVVGLGRIGTRLARLARAFDMR